jgi:antibiotic biosynthesis monooxygenase (ABM) superfamily enzyme
MVEEARTPMSRTPVEPPANVARAVFTVQIVPGREAEFIAWIGRLEGACQAFPGFVASEIVKPVPGIQDDWVTMVSFDTREHLRAWLDSDTRRDLLTESAPLVVQRQQEGVFASREPGREGVTVVVHGEVPPGSESDFRKWQHGISQAAARRPGFQDARLFPPLPPYQDDWVIIYSFDTEAHLRGWLESPERQQWLRREKAVFHRKDERRLAGGFGNWFAMASDTGTFSLPPPWKQAMTVLLVLYPTVMLVYTFILPFLLRTVPQPLAVFASNVISVATLQYAAMRLANRALRFWLHPKESPRWPLNLGGAGLVLACYAVLILGFIVARGGFR